jgi:hypothetical protein
MRFPANLSFRDVIANCKSHQGNVWTAWPWKSLGKQKKANLLSTYVVQAIALPFSDIKFTDKD